MPLPVVRLEMAALVAFIAVAAALFECALGTTINVGGPLGGWDLTTDLQTWAASQTFSVGDTLLFSYTLDHSVLQVTKSDYDACVTTNPITSGSSGLSTVDLIGQGKVYYICGTPRHCAAGMKIEVDVSGTSAPTAPAGAPQSSPDVPAADAPSSSPDVPAADTPPSSPDVPATDAPSSSPDVPAADAPPSSPKAPGADAPPSSSKAPAARVPSSPNTSPTLPEKSTPKLAPSAAAGLKASAAAGVFATGLLALLAL